MDGGGAASDAPEIDRVDVSNLPLEELIGSDSTALNNALRRLVAQVEQPRESYAAFGNTP